VSRPGIRLRALAARFCSEKTMGRLIDPVIADLQLEHGAATRSGNIWKRGWVLIVGYIAFVKVVLLCSVFGTRQACRNWDKDDSNMLLRTTCVSGIAIVLVSVPLWLPQLSRTREMLETFSSSSTASLWQLMIYLLPSVLPLSVPLGLGIGTAFSTRGRMLSNRVIAAVMLVALVMSAASLVTIGWVTPNVNQAYREAISGARWLNKGDREMTLTELRPAAAGSDQEKAHRLSVMFHQRLSLSTTPVTFAAFGLVLAIRRLRAIIALGAIVLASFGYYVAMWVAQRLSQTAELPTFLGPWMPPVALILTTVLLGLLRVNRTRA
jgi:lipopolysaccharide export LptBFGC system permease protein LptF